VLWLFAPLPGAAATPTESVRDLFAAVNTILADPAAREHPLGAVAGIHRLVTEAVDVSTAAAVALGREWHVRSLDERNEFVDLFAALLERAYVGRLVGIARVSEGVAVSYRGEVVTGAEATVTTALAARRDDAIVEYRMTSRDGHWLIRDVVLDGVSIVENYQAQFRHLLRRGTYADLVSRLRDKLAEDSLLFARIEPRALAARPATAQTGTATAAAPEPPSPSETPVMVASETSSATRIPSEAPVSVAGFVKRAQAMTPAPVALTAPAVVLATTVAAVASSTPALIPDGSRRSLWASVLAILALGIILYLCLRSEWKRARIARASTIREIA